MLRISLTETQRSELNALCQTDLPAVPRNRVEMVLISADGWSPPRIGTRIGSCRGDVRADTPSPV